MKNDQEMRQLQEPHVCDVTVENKWFLFMKHGVD